jgi:predicted dehydrogenase
MATTLPECNAMIGAGQNADVSVMIAGNTTFDPCHQVMKKVTASESHPIGSDRNASLENLSSS